MASPSRPPLKAVPPTQIPPKQSQNKPPTSQVSQPPKSDQQPPPKPPTPTEKPARNWLQLGAIAILLAAGGVYIFSPATVYVKGVAHFEPQENQIRGAYLAFPGKVKKFWVGYGNEVKQGQPIADIEAIALESEIAQKKAQLQEKQAQLETQKTQIIVIEAELRREGQKTAIARRREADYRSKLNRGIDAPEMQKIMQEINVIQTRLMNIKSEKIKSVQQLQGVKKILQQYDTPEMQEVKDEKIISAISLEKELKELESQKFSLQAQIQQQDQRALEIKHQIQAKSAELSLLQENRQDRLQEHQDEVMGQLSNLVPLQRKLEAAKITTESLKPVIQTLEQELEDLENRHLRNITLKAPITGKIITPDLPQKIGQKITEEKPVLTIANLKEMVATIEIPQWDAGLVKQGFGEGELPVTLKPREIEIDPFQSSIKEIELLFDSDESGQKQLMLVRATVDNHNLILSPNSEADASIAVGRLPRYQIWWREIRKQLRQYL